MERRYCFSQKGKHVLQDLLNTVSRRMERMQEVGPASLGHDSVTAEPNNGIWTYNQRIAVKV